MKKLTVLSLILLLLLVGCGAAEETAVSLPNPVLTISDGESQKTYTAAELQALPQVEATFNNVTYTGVALTVLLENSGMAVDNLKAVKAIAADGFSANYELAQIQKADVIVAYAQADGSLTAEDGTFRMVMPEEEGKSNVRQLVEIQGVR